MKKILALLFNMICLSGLLFAQSDNYKLAVEKFTADYNADRHQQIFESFSDEMKQELPLDKVTQFLSGLKMQAGKLEHTKFMRYQGGSYAVYKAQFTQIVLALSISLNENNKINGLLLRPYQDSSEAKSSTVNALQSYPKSVADKLFAHAKDFPENTQVAVAVIENGKTNFYGVIKIHDTLKPAQNQQKIFEIGSLTKVFTATVLASLVEAGKLNLTDNINTVFPFAFKDNIQISFLSLANHTSGLPRLPENLNDDDNENPYKSYGKAEMDAYLKTYLKPEQEPGKAYAYSNLGAGLLGYTLGVSQKTSFTQLLQKNVFNKYKMMSSFTNAKQAGSRLVKGQNANGLPCANWDFYALFAAGGILSDVEDLAEFAKAQFDPANKALALTQLPTFTIDNNMKIGLGWHLLKSKTGKDLLWHNGGTGGYTSSMSINVREKTAVVILSNLSAFHPKMQQIDELCFELIGNTGK